MTAAVRLTLLRDGAAAPVVFLGALFAARGTELWLDGQRVARWRHDLVSWLDEHGVLFTGFDVDAVGS